MRITASPLSALAAASTATRAKSTYALQSSMARLPVPPLTDTLERYLRSVQPLVTEEEFRRTKAAVEEFKRPGGAGERLHKKLLEHAASIPNGSWLEGWWFDMYFSTRDANPINVNYFFGFRDDATARDASTRAARLVHATLKFKVMLDNETLTPDMMKDKPLDMSQFPYILSGCRLPAKGTDTFEVYKGSRHIVVVHRNNFVSVEVMSADGQPHSVSQIQGAFRKILSMDLTRAPAVGALTAAERDFWADANTRLLANNRESVDMIRRAITVVCLDDITPANATEMSRALLHGDGQNRWFDKMVLVVFPNGSAGLNMEHSMVDGHSLLRYANYIVEEGEKTTKDATATTSRITESPSTVLRWNLSPETHEDIEKASLQIEQLIHETESSVLQFRDFGKKTITKLGVGPDAFAQMAMQLAYYRHFGCFAATYESCTTRPFLHGRTETIRSVTNESVAFCKAFDCPDVPAERKAELTRAACEQHTKVSRDAAAAMGVDRHLLGLRTLAAKEGGKMPAIFRDPAHWWTRQWLLSTSHCGSPNLTMFGFGPVFERCVGSGYMVNDNDICYNITSKYLGSRRYVDILRKSLLDMKEVMEKSPPVLRAKL